MVNGPDQSPQFQPEGSQSESHIAKSEQFQNALTQIQTKPLNAENIDYYASSALTDLISLTDSVLSEYCTDNPSNSLFGKELEDTAFNYFGLANMGTVLDHVATKQVELDQIDALIDSARLSSHVIVPTDGESRIIQPGEEEFRARMVLSRTKTILFVLSNQFDIDVTDPKQVQLKTGILNDSMMRKLSYFLINVPKLNRTLLCCDEEGNATYIFDTSVLNKYGMTPDDISTLTKKDINDLLEADPKLGRKMIYSNRFAPRIIDFINDLTISEKSEVTTVAYLAPKAPEGVLPIYGIAKKLGIHSNTVNKVVKEVEEQLGPTGVYRFGQVTSRGFTPEQQELIIGKFKANEVYRTKPPEGALAVAGLARKFGTSDATMSQIIKELGTDLGELNKYRFGGLFTPGFTLEQQEIIKNALAKKGIFAETAPTEVMSISRMAQKYGLAHNAVKKVVEELGEKLGEPKTYRFGRTRKIFDGYNLSQQAMIKQELEKKGMLTEQAPEETLSRTAFARIVGMNPMNLQKFIDKLGEDLGPVRKYRFSARFTNGYTPEQQEKIIKALEKIKPPKRN